jgi:AbrB family looped-hinge helix DNA binding protein
MRITDKGQVTIPIAVREQLGLAPGDEVDFVVDQDGEVRLVRAASRTPRGRRLVAHLANRGDVPMSTDEIMALTRGD